MRDENVVDYKKGVEHIIWRLFEASSSLGACSRKQRRFRVDSVVGGFTREHLYSIVVSKDSIKITCKVGRLVDDFCKDIHDIISVLKGAGYYDGDSADEAVELLDGAAKRLKDGKPAREAWVLDLTPETFVEELFGDVPPWILKDLYTSILPQLVKFLLDEAIFEQNRYEGVGTFRKTNSDLDELMGRLEVSGSLGIVEPRVFGRGPACLVSKKETE